MEEDEENHNEEEMEKEELEDWELKEPAAGQDTISMSRFLCLSASLQGC
jgi:hypothetical protein